MKRLLSVLLAITFVLSAAFTASAFDDDGEWAYVDGMAFVTYNNKTCTLTGLASSDIAKGDFVIPDTVYFNGKELPVTRIGIYAFAECSEMTSVKLPESLVGISRGAFIGCGLTTIKIPASVSTIAEEHNPFAGCPIANIEVDENNGTFFTDNGVLFCRSHYPTEDSIDLCLYPYKEKPDDEYTVPDGTTTIRGDAGINAKKVTLPDGLLTIDAHAFWSCSNIESINIPNSVTYIGGQAFSSCENLKSIAIPSSVEEISSSAFDYCTSLTEINVDENNPVCSSVDGVFFNKDKTVLYQYPAGKEADTYAIPDGVTSVGSFYGVSKLKSISIPLSVRQIGSFDGCDDLKTVYYEGSEKQWRKVYGFKNLSFAEIIFGIDDPVPPLTKESYDNMQKTVDFICEIYFAEALYNYEDIGYGYYISMILYDAAKAFPEKAEYRAEDVNHEYGPEFVRLTEEEAVSVVNNKYSYIDGETLYYKYTCMLLEGLRETDFEAERTGGKSAPYVKNAQKGKLEGYKDNKDGTYSFYYSYATKLSGYDLFTGEELAEYRKLESEAWTECKDFEYKGHTFYYDSGANGDGYYTPGEPEYREFNFSLTEDGKVIYNYDQWGIELPEKFDDIPTDIIPGDMNGDEQTDNKDVVTLFRAVSGNSGGYNAAFDFNEDGEVNNKDVVALFRYVSAAK